MEHNSTLIAQIEAFVNQHGMAESTFGRKAVGDWKLVSQLREGRELRRKTLERVKAFMASQ